MRLIRELNMRRLEDRCYGEEGSIVDLIGLLQVEGYSISI